MTSQQLSSLSPLLRHYVELRPLVIPMNDSIEQASVTILFLSIHKCKDVFVHYLFARQLGVCDEMMEREFQPVMR